MMLRIAKFLYQRRKAVVFYLLLLLGGMYLGELLRQFAISEIQPFGEPEMYQMLAVAFVLYVVLTAIPFVPGVEIGFAMLMLLGPSVAPLVYFGMVGALTLAFLLAKLVSANLTEKAFVSIGFNKAGALVHQLDALPMKERRKFLYQHSHGRFTKLLARHRYIALGLLMNMPGNTLLGGGGGLAFIAALSGMFSFWGFLLTVLIAVAPVPIFVGLWSFW